MSILEDQFLDFWQSQHPELKLQREVLPIPKRRFRLDFAHLPTKVAIEINGGTWRKGGHSSGKGLLRDYEKLNLAQANGWVVFQLSREMIGTDWVERIATTINSRK